MQEDGELVGEPAPRHEGGEREGGATEAKDEGQHEGRHRPGTRGGGARRGRGRVGPRGTPGSSLVVPFHSAVIVRSAGKPMVKLQNGRFQKGIFETLVGARTPLGSMRSWVGRVGSRGGEGITT